MNELYAEVYIPSDEMLALRDICRGRATLTRMRVEVQMKIKSGLFWSIDDHQ